MSLSACRRAPPPAALLVGPAGVVTVERGDKRLTGADQLALRVGDRVQTGPDGSASVVLRRGRRVVLGHDTLVLIADNAVISGDVGLVLREGRLKADSGAEGGLVIDTIFGRLRSGAGLTVLDVDVDRGVAVQLGSIDVERPNSQVELVAGRQLTVDGLVLGSGAGGGVLDAEGVDLWRRPPPATAALATLQPQGGAAVRAAGEQAFRPADRPTVLSAGDHVLVAAGGGRAELVFAPGEVLRLMPGSRVELLGGSPLRPSWRLLSGAAALAMTHGAGGDAAHTVQLGERLLRVAPGVREADVQVAATDGGGSARAAVRFGRVWEGEAPVPPGSTLTLARGAPRSGPLTDYKVEVKTRPTIVYYDRAPPALDLTWGAPGAAQIVEVAQDAQFTHLIAAEASELGHLLIDRISEPGSYFWRLQGSPAAVYTLQVSAERPPGCLSCVGRNVVDDSGDKTTIYFQNQPPALDLRGTALRGARAYRFEVFAADDSQHALFSARRRVPFCAVPSGRLGEGNYLWSMRAEGPGRRALGARRSNALQIAFDNVLDSLQLRSPRHDLRTGAATLEVAGELQLGHRLWLQNEPVAVDANGRFSRSLALTPGANVLVFRTEGDDQVVRMWARRVERS